MAIDFTHPQISDNYSTGYTAGIVANQIAQAQWLDSVQTTITAGAVQYMKRYNRTSQLFEEYNGSAWATLATNYAVLTANTNVFSGSAPNVAINSSGTQTFQAHQFLGTTKFSLSAFSSGVNFGFLNSAGTAVFYIDQSGNGTFAGTVGATQFNGSGAGLTGTGANFTAGAASTLTTTNSYTMASLNIGTSGVYFYDSGSGQASIRGSNGAGGYNYLTLANNGTLQVNGGVVQTQGANLVNTAIQLLGAGVGNLRNFNYYGSEISWQGSTGSPNQYFNFSDTAGNNGGSFNLYIRGLNSGSSSSVNLASIQLLANTVACSSALTAQTVTQTSDETKKHNWETPDSRATVRALSKMKTWGNFDFIESGIKSLGVGAQSIRKIPAFKNAIHGDKKTGLTMNYGGAAMVASIALSKELEALRARVAALEAA